MKRRRSHACSFGVVLALALLSARSGAQEDPRKAQAEAAFAEALKLHNADHEAEALERFQKSYALFPAVNALYWIAREEQLLGRGLEALRHYREVLKAPLASPKTLDLAKKFIAELEPRFARALVKGPAGASFQLGGKQLRLPVEDAIDLDPGTIVVTGERDGVEYSATGLGEAGKTTTLELKAKSAGTQAPPAATAPITEPPAEPRAEATFWGWRSVGGFVLLGAGAVAVVVGVAAKSEESSQSDKLASLTSALPPGEPGARCFNSTAQACIDYQSARAARDSAESRGDTWLPIGIGAAVLGAAFVASAIVWPHGRSSSTGALKSPRLAPVMGRGGNGLFFISDF